LREPVLGFCRDGLPMRKILGVLGDSCFVRFRSSVFTIVLVSGLSCCRSQGRRNFPDRAIQDKVKVGGIVACRPGPPSDPLTGSPFALEMQMLKGKLQAVDECETSALRPIAFPSPTIIPSRYYHVLDNAYRNEVQNKPPSFAQVADICSCDMLSCSSKVG